MSDVVPFGKYKGQPVEALAQDRQHVEWLTAQPWFKDRYQTIYNVIVNNFQEPSETPEHNGLQVLFLEKEFCEKLLYVALDEDATDVKVTFESDGFDVKLIYVKNWTKFDEVGNLVEYSCGGERYVEIKPSVGDDYPAVLRQMKAAGTEYSNGRAYPNSRRAILFLEKYIGVGATEEQFIAIFESDGIKVVFRDEVY